MVENVELETLANVECHLEEIGSYVESHPEIGLNIFPFNCQVGKDKKVTITIDTPTGTINLNDFLPDKLFIINWKGSLNHPEATCNWRQDNWSLLGAEVYIDIDWLRNTGAIGVVCLAHEIGHCFAWKEKLAYEKSHHQDQPEEPDEKTITKYDVERFIRYGCYYANCQIKSEVEAYNYGKALIHLFSVNEETYEDLMDYTLKTHAAEVYVVVNEELKNYLDIYKQEHEEFQTEETFSIYDPSIQTEIDIPYSELKNYLSKYTPDRYYQHLKETESKTTI